MRAPVEWLREYVDVPDDLPALAHTLTMAGLAVEGVEEVEGEAVLVFELTPNRGDCHGIVNLAREIAAITGAALRLPPAPPQADAGSVRQHVEVDIHAPSLCGRYAARIIEDVKVGPSPRWLQSRLLQCGVRPINNVVDVTNYVMLETNQPLHAFDHARLAERRIVVRRAERGERIVTLDGVERVLDEEMLVIADALRPVAVAGVMGGLDSEVSDSTRTVLLESAYFSASSVRRTSRRLGLRTEASIRFEKGTDPDGVLWAAQRAVDLMERIGAGRAVPGVCDVYPGRSAPRIVEVRPARVNALLGTDLGADQMQGYLQALQMEVRRAGDALMVTAPSYRPDLAEEADMVEEIARLHGYDRISPTVPTGPMATEGHNPWLEFRRSVRQVLAGAMNEVVTYSFINPRWLELLGLPEGSPLRQPLRLANPLSEEQSVMRTTILPGVLEVVARNLARRNENQAIFEVGAVFMPSAQPLPLERQWVCAVTAGRTAVNWGAPALEMDFYYLKGIAEHLLDRTGIQGCRFQAAGDIPYLHPYRAARIMHGERAVGTLGELHPRVLEGFGIRKRACALELDLEVMYSLAGPRRMSEGIARFPAVVRDIALVLGEEVEAERVDEVIRAAGGPLLRSVLLFDVYRGAPVPAGKKSMA
ncbi:MAG: phenylalanine--tRNA ligase subunit beta, partial [Syntrophomonadaceae bacterium]|nr:phenylalanine--tRNA ligase subunit beta [Syntrophomonadaceae bacterium]